MSNITNIILTHIQKDARKHAIHFHLDYDDALSISYLGLVKAENRFDPKRNVPFLPYARKIILWEHRSQNRNKNGLRQTRNKKNKLLPQSYPLFREVLETDLTLDGVQQAEQRDLLNRLQNHIKNLNIKEKDLFIEVLFKEAEATEWAKKTMRHRCTTYRKKKKFAKVIKYLKTSYLAA